MWVGHGLLSALRLFDAKATPRQRRYAAGAVVQSAGSHLASISTPAHFWASKLVGKPEPQQSCAGQVGTYLGMTRYDKGKPPPIVISPTHFCGTPEMFLDGATTDDPPLTWTDFGYSECCLDNKPHNFWHGGVGAGGAANVDRLFSGIGGASVGGAADITYLFASEGGIKCGGGADVSRLFVSTGGCKVGGAYALPEEFSSGGCKCGGAASY